MGSASEVVKSWVKAINKGPVETTTQYLAPNLDWLDQSRSKRLLPVRARSGWASSRSPSRPRRKSSAKTIATRPSSSPPRSTVRTIATAASSKCRAAR